MILLSPGTRKLLKNKRICLLYRVMKVERKRDMHNLFTSSYTQTILEMYDMQNNYLEKLLGNSNGFASVTFRLKCVIIFNWFIKDIFLIIRRLLATLKLVENRWFSIWRYWFRVIFFSNKAQAAFDSYVHVPWVSFMFEKLVIFFIIMFCIGQNWLKYFIYFRYTQCFKNKVYNFILNTFFKKPNKSE